MLGGSSYTIKQTPSPFYQNRKLEKEKRKNLKCGQKKSVVWRVLQASRRSVGGIIVMPCICVTCRPVWDRDPVIGLYSGSTGHIRTTWTPCPADHVSRNAMPCTGLGPGIMVTVFIFSIYTSLSDQTNVKIFHLCTLLLWKGKKYTQSVIDFQHYKWTKITWNNSTATIQWC